MPHTPAAVASCLCIASLAGYYRAGYTGRGYPVLVIVLVDTCAVDICLDDAGGLKRACESMSVSHTR